MSDEMFFFLLPYVAHPEISIGHVNQPNATILFVIRLEKKKLLSYDHPLKRHSEKMLKNILLISTIIVSGK